MPWQAKLALTGLVLGAILCALGSANEDDGLQTVGVLSLVVGLVSGLWWIWSL